MFFAIIILLFIVISINKKIYKSPLKIFIPFVLLATFTLILGINILSSGKYADENNLDGGSVGWFGSYGVIVSGLTIILSFIMWIYLINIVDKKIRLKK